MTPKQEIKLLRELVQFQDKLLAVYRLGGMPQGRVLDRIRELKLVLGYRTG